MSANNAFFYTIRKTVLTQIGLVFATAAIATFLKGNEFLWSTLYGGATVAISTIYFGWKLMIATNAADNNSSVNSVELFKGIIIRFFIVVGLLALGMGWLKLAPAGVLIGLIAAQIAYWFSKTSYGVTRRK